MDFKDLMFEKKDHIATITLNRPHVLNALTPEMMESLEAVYRVLEEDGDIRVAIFTGAGRGFCSGADLRQPELANPTQRGPRLHPGEQWIARLMGISKPTIAAVNGPAVGGGLALALGCDIRIASEDARFSAIFSNIGFPVRDGIGWLLPRIVGLSKALELIYTADMVDVREAERIGLVSYVVPVDKLMERALGLAQTIATKPPLALQFSKGIVYQSLHRSYAEHLPHQYYIALANSTFVPHDAQEGARAFREHRKPKFRGMAPLKEGDSTQDNS